jgi:uncharacterized protein YprB with RNaseH-like and TPR domain
MRLREKLERMEGSLRKMGPASRSVPIEAVVRGKVKETDHGSFYLVETEYEGDYCYGGHSVRCALSLDTDGVCVAGKDDRLDSFDARSCTFLDVETTGLAGGSGTYPFLIGLGYYRRSSFVVSQLFMRDYDEEGAVLSFLSELFAPRRYVVTYNGKSFDMPLIETRMTINGMDRIADETYNLDLLHAARRIWGRTLPDCRLKTLEERMLGLYRRDDIPGEEIPERYFEYIRSGDASGLRVVFEHNRNDVLMLPVLLGHITSAIRDADSDALEPLDLYSIGRVYDNMKRRDETLPFYTRALRRLRGSERTMVACQLGIVYKRLNMWEEAVSTWRGLLGKGVYQPYEELAKYYEHVSKEYARAKEIVGEALQTFEGTGHDKNLKYRLARIERKLSLRGRT